MKYCVLSSGSKGNCTYIEINNKSYLIDVGCNFLYLSRKLKEINVDPNQISGIFLTHSHTDHTSALEQFIKKVNPKIYASTKIINSLKKFETNNLVEDYELNIDNLNIKTIILSHDVEECRGFIFNNKGTELVYITDTGYINEKYHEELCDKDAYIIESNHDVDMLMNTSRPHYLKMRILGDSGHISNDDCGYYLSKFIGNKTKNIILAHLSEQANCCEKAIESVKKQIGDSINITVAMQNERTGVFEI